MRALTKTVIETALDEEMAEHLGYDRHDPVGGNRGRMAPVYRSDTQKRETRVQMSPPLRRG